MQWQYRFCHYCLILWSRSKRWVFSLDVVLFKMGLQASGEIYKGDSLNLDAFSTRSFFSAGCWIFVCVGMHYFNSKTAGRVNIHSVWCVYRVTPPADILFSYKSQADEVDNDEVILPNQPVDFSIPDTTAADLVSSIDSTHFTSASPNPLYHTMEYHNDLLPAFGRLTFSERTAMSGSVNAWIGYCQVCQLSMVSVWAKKF